MAETSYKQVSNRDRVGTRDEKLIREVRENFDFDTEAFSNIRDEGSKDIRFISNDPWPDKEKQARRDNDRPMMACDELNQYTNLVINEVRQHPREIKISPAGFGATAKLAELRENRIRAIQYKSDAQACYVTAIENCVQRGYGFGRVSLRYTSDTSFDQEICIKRIPNPDAVLFDVGCKELDCSDAKHCFVMDKMTKKDFERQWPDAEIKDFEGELAGNYPQWIQDKFVQVAEYWRVEEKKDELLQFDGGKAGILTELMSKLKARGGMVSNSMVIYPAFDGHPEIRVKLLNNRDTRVPTILQYITNGVEILEQNEWVGKWIPIVPVFGKELYITEAGGSKRMIMSLIRNARDSQMSYNYVQTCKVEAIGRVPRTTWMALEGTFEGHEQEVADANKIPKPYLYYKSVQKPDGTYSETPPQREPFDPPIQNLEIASESFRRCIQSAVGMYNSSVGRQDTNVKSGVAIKELDAQSDQGSFHFIDNYNRFIVAIGRIVNDLQSKIEITPRQAPIRMKDGKEKLVWLNREYQDDQGQTQHHDMKLGEYDVTISVQPSADSQREAASDFLETLVEELPALQEDPAKRDALLALSIELKQLGPLGDQMVKILQPPQGDPAQAQQQLQQLQSQVTELQTENAGLHQDRARRELEAQTKIQIEQMRVEAKGQSDAANHANEQAISQMQNDIKVLVALITAKNQNAQQEQEMYKEFWLENHKAAHEAGIQATEHAHAHSIADKQAQTAAMTQASDQAHQQTMQENQPEPEAQ